MNYLNEERKNALSAEYVLGSLQGAARVRYQRLLMQHRGLRHNLWRWEAQLNQLGGTLPSIQPDPKVWNAIQHRLGFQTDLTTDTNTQNLVSFPQRKPRGLLWFTGFSTAAAILLAVLLINTNITTTAYPNQIAVMQSENAEALWLIELREKQLQITTTRKFTPLENQDYELWMVATDGRPPISLGLLPEKGRLNLPRSHFFDELSVAALAVSLEPPGGSPTGQPSKVLYTAELVTL